MDDKILYKGRRYKLRQEGRSKYILCKGTKVPLKEVRAWQKGKKGGNGVNSADPSMTAPAPKAAHSREILAASRPTGEQQVNITRESIDKAVSVCFTFDEYKLLQDIRFLVYGHHDNFAYLDNYNNNVCSIMLNEIKDLKPFHKEIFKKIKSLIPEFNTIAATINSISSNLIDDTEFVNETNLNKLLGNSFEVYTTIVDLVETSGKMHIDLLKMEVTYSDRNDINKNIMLIKIYDRENEYNQFIQSLRRLSNYVIYVITSFIADVQYMKKKGTKETKECIYLNKTDNHNTQWLIDRLKEDQDSAGFMSYVYNRLKPKKNSPQPTMGDLYNIIDFNKPLYCENYDIFKQNILYTVIKVLFNKFELPVAIQEKPTILNCKETLVKLIEQRFIVEDKPKVEALESINKLTT